MKTPFIILNVTVALATLSFGEQVNLATAERNLNEAVTESHGVFVCRLVKQGSALFGPLGMSLYVGAEFEVQQSLRGEPVAKITCSYLARVNPPERIPKVGEDYIVIGHQTSADFDISKLLDATTKNIDLVTTLLATGSDHAKTGNFQPDQIDSAHKMRLDWLWWLFALIAVTCIAAWLWFRKVRKTMNSE